MNVALHSDYEALKRIREKHLSWAAAWASENGFYPSVDPEAEREKLSALGIRIVLREDPEYPALLKEIFWAPWALYVKGHLPSGPAVAIVGTRRATAKGRSLAGNLAAGLSKQGVVVVSGLAMGIDEAAHEAVVKLAGKTAAVLATGLDRVYPAQNANLAKKILESGGALISEYPPGMPSFPSNFVHRNRIVSGLSLATVVIEAPEKSGALITANFAVEQNREVLAVPGPADSENYSGSHRLIRDGAKLVVSVEQILSEIGLECRDFAAPGSGAGVSSPEEKIILEVLGKIGWPASADKISEITKIEVPKINQIITLLTLRGILKE